MEMMLTLNVDGVEMIWREWGLLSCLPIGPRAEEKNLAVREEAEWIGDENIKKEWG